MIKLSSLSSEKVREVRIVKEVMAGDILHVAIYVFNFQEQTRRHQ